MKAVPSQSETAQEQKQEVSKMLFVLSVTTQLHDTIPSLVCKRDIKLL